MLGTVEVAGPEGWTSAGPAKRGCVLAALAWDAGTPVPVETLTHRVWGDDPPVAAHSTLYGHIARLRTLLRQCPAPVEIRKSGGYVLDVDPGDVDVHAARLSARRARAHLERGETAAALAEWREADGWWRGEPLSGVEGAWAAELRSRLRGEHASMLAERFTAELAHGEHASIVAELRRHVTTYPWDEALAECLMTALYRCGRQVDALAVYTGLRDRLAEDQGVEPGQSMRRLHRRVLSHDASLHHEAAMSPSQLPAAPRRFTGRDHEIAVLDEAVDLDGGPRVWTISGPGGIGKSWLALHWAQRHRDAFPDGQLYVDLNGFDATAEPVTAASALRGLLQSLGIAPAAIPIDSDAMAAMLRSLTADKRMLLLIDDARDAAQVVPLLPAATSCFTLVTGRSPLTALAVSHGARGVRLSVFDDRDAHAALVDQLGSRRVAAEPRAASELVTTCAGLPLAVGILAARAASRPDLPLSTLADTTRDDARRLDVWETGEVSASLRVVIDASVRTLGDGVQRLFMLLASMLGADAGVHAVASLAETSIARVEPMLRELEAVGLVEQHRPRRYRTHDLTRAYARELAAERLDADERTAALRRVVTHYLDTAVAVRRCVAPGVHDLVAVPEPGNASVVETFGDEAAGLRWIDLEMSNVFEALRVAADNAWNESTWHLASMLFTMSVRQRDFTRQLVACRHAETAARDLGDRFRLVVALRASGSAACDLGEHDTAVEYLERAIATIEPDDDHGLLANAHSDLARSHFMRGDYARAVAHSRTALERVGPTGHDRVRYLNSHGWHLAHLGEFDAARAHCEQALELARATGDRLVGYIMDSLGFIAFGGGDAEAARRYYEQAIVAYRQRGVREFGSRAMLSLAGVHESLGEHDAAVRWRREAAELYERQGFIDAAAAVRRELDD